MRQVLTVACVFIVAGGGALAQSKDEFEVATIKPSAPDTVGEFIHPGPGGGIAISNMTLKEMIRVAWQVQPFQIAGGPSWMDSIHYDVTAKPEVKAQRSELAGMLESLLKDRFQLAIHNETRELPIYALVLARKDGKLGPGLTRPEQSSCTQADPSQPAPAPKPSEPPRFACGGMRMGPRGLTAASIPIAGLAPALSRLLGRTVVDKTGLTGRFDVKVEWTPDDLQLPAGAPADATSPSVFTAFQEQLGLRIESQKGPVEMLVVDRAEKPSEN